MVQKIFIGNANTASFECPECKKVKTASIARFKGLSTVVRVRCKCPCGHNYSVMLERRKHIRKASDFQGTFIHENANIRGTMSIINLSRGGVRLKLNFPCEIKVGDKLRLDFILDDKQSSRVSKEVVVRSVSDLNIGTEFSSMEHYDKLGAYLLFDFA